MRLVHLLYAILLPLITHAFVGFYNPLKSYNGSDPFMVYSDGYYYLLTTTWSNIQITRSTTIAGLKTATPEVVWSDSTASRCCNVWAPEVHYIAG
jgi:GH43 family beta-xylosidase